MEHPQPPSTSSEPTVSEAGADAGTDTSTETTEPVEVDETTKETTEESSNDLQLIRFKPPSTPRPRDLDLELEFELELEPAGSLRARFGFSPSSSNTHTHTHTSSNTTSSSIKPPSAKETYQTSGSSPSNNNNHKTLQTFPEFKSKIEHHWNGSMLDSKTGDIIIRIPVIRLSKRDLLEEISYTDGDFKDVLISESGGFWILNVEEAKISDLLYDKPTEEELRIVRAAPFMPDRV